MCSDFCNKVSKTTSVESQSSANRSKTASTRSSCRRANSKTLSGAGASGKNWGVMAVSCTENEALRASLDAVAMALAACVAAFRASSTPSSAPSWRDSSVFGSGRGSRPAREHRGQTRKRNDPRHRAMDTSSKRGDRTVLRRAVAVVAVLLARALDFTDGLMEVAHLRGVALLDVLDGLLEAADPALDRGDEFSR